MADAGQDRSRSPAPDAVGLPRGEALDPQGRCRHWDGPSDVVLLRLPCCPGFWGCHDCHQAVADHEAQRWPPHRFDQEAVLCGACGGTLAIRRYLEVTACPACGHPFNPRCALHHHRYFELPGGAPAEAP